MPGAFARTSVTDSAGWRRCNASQSFRRDARSCSAATAAWRSFRSNEDASKRYAWEREIRVLAATSATSIPRARRCSASRRALGVSDLRRSEMGSPSARRRTTIVVTASPVFAATSRHDSRRSCSSLRTISSCCAEADAFESGFEGFAEVRSRRSATVFSIDATLPNTVPMNKRWQMGWKERSGRWHRSRAHRIGSLADDKSRSR